MLARIAHELYWIGRQLARAEHTARMLDGVFHADVQGAAGRPGGRAAVVGRAADDHRRRAARPPGDARRGRARLTLDPDDPGVGRLTASRRRARARAPCATCSRREMWEAINTFHLGLLRRDISAALRTGPYSVYAYVRERCGLFWGVTEPHDAARRGARVPAGGRRDRVRRHGAADAARRAARPTRVRRRAHLRDGQALALLQAVGGFQAYRRAVPAPPNAGRSRASCSTSATTRTRWPSRSRRCTPR